MTGAEDKDDQSSPRRTSRWLLRFFASVTVVLLLFGPYLARILTRPITRYHFMWQTRDAAHLLASIVGLALACLFVGAVVHRLAKPWLTRAFNHLFVLALGAGILANFGAFASEYLRLDYSSPFSRIEMRIGWAVLIGIVVWSYWRRSTKLVLRSRQLCQILAPTIVLVAVQLFSFETYPDRQDLLMLSAGTSMKRAGDRPRSVTHPVYVLVFDEWSYRRTFDGGRVRNQFSNLQAIAAESLVFHDARSPDGWTHGSMPRLLFQTDLPVVWGRGYEGFEEGEEFVPSRTLVSWFEKPALADHQAVMLGFHLPYQAWLGDQADIYRVYRWYERGETPAECFGLQFLEAVHYWTDPISDAAYDPLRLRVDDRHVLRLRADLKEDLLSVIQQGRDDVAVIWHYPLPHFPFISEPDGRYRGPDERAWNWADVEGYRRNLAQMDVLLGELIGAMKQAGQFEDTMLILTSDHNWRYDPTRKERPRQKDAITHVPLIVKLPGEAMHRDVTEVFKNVELWRLVSHAIQSDGDHDTPSQRVARWLSDEGLIHGGVAAAEASGE